MQKNILLIANSFEFLEQYKLGLSKELMNKGNKIYWLFPSDKNLTKKFKGINLIKINGKRSSFLTIKKLILFTIGFKIFKRNVIFISHTAVCNFTSFISSLFFFRRNVFLVVTGFGPSRIRNSLVYRLYGRLYLFLLRIASGMSGVEVQVLNITDKILIQDYLYSRQVIQINESGVTKKDLEKGYFSMSKKLKDIDKRKLKIGFFGRFLLEKGIEDFKIMVNLLTDLELEFDFFVGGDKDSQNSSSIQINPFLDSLKNTQVKIKPNYDDFFSDIDILIFPSYREGQPKYLIRSMGFGVVVIAYPSAGLSSIIIDEYNGILTKHKNPLNLAANLIRLNKNRPELKNLSRNAFKYIKNREQSLIDVNLANHYTSC